MRLLRILVFVILLSFALSPRAYAGARFCSELFRPELTQIEVDAQEKALEKFLNDESIPFSKSKAPKHGSLTAHMFELRKPTKAKSPAGQLLIEAQSFEKAEDHARVVVDTLYDERTLAAAHYTAADQVITLSPRGLTGAADGTRDYFAHELEHHREQIYVKHGDISLARLNYRKEGAVMDASYDFNLNFDELDAYLVSLKFYRGKDAVRERAVRSQLTMLIAKERTLIGLLKKRLESPSDEEAQAIAFGGFEGKIVPMNGHYEFEIAPGEKIVMRVSYVQVLPRRPIFNQSRWLIDRTIIDAEERIDTIEKELASLK